MLEPADLPSGSAGYSALGLIANPFRSAAWQPSEETVSELVTHGVAARLAAGLDASIRSGNTEPVWASGDAGAAGLLRRLAVSEVVYSLTNNDAFNALVINIPFPILSLGKVRSALGMVAERLAGESFGRTLGMYVAHSLRDFDAALPEAALLTAEECDALRRRFEQDSEGSSGEIFGESVSEREPDASIEDMMRETGARQSVLPVDPEESDRDPEVDEAMEIVALEAEVPAEEEPVDEAAELARRLREYVVAFAAAHLSPVVSRGLVAYVTSGTDKLGQELKITKAPRKTLKALCTLACFRFRGVVLLYDDFDSWHVVPDDLRGQIVATMTELRWALKPMAVLSFVAPQGQVPELEEQFSSARPVDWHMVETIQELTADEPLGEATVRTLLGFSALTEGVDPAVVDGVLAALDESGGDLEHFVLAAGAWIDARAKEVETDA